MVICLCALSALFCWAELPVSALVCDLQGEAKRQAQEGTWSAVAILDGLRLGDVIVLEPGATAQLSMVERGTQATLQGPCKIQLGEGRFVLLQGGSTAMQTTVPVAARGTTAPARLNLDRLGGLIRPKPARQPRWSTDAIVMADQAALTWEAPSSYKRFQIRLSDAEKVVFSGEFKRERKAKVAHLEPGEVYSVDFQAWSGQQKDPDFEWTGTLETLSEAEAQSIPVADKDVPGLAIRLTHLIRLGLYTPALRTCREMSQLRPKQSVLSETAKKLEAIVGNRGL